MLHMFFSTSSGFGADTPRAVTDHQCCIHFYQTYAVILRGIIISIIITLPGSIQPVQTGTLGVVRDRVNAVQTASIHNALAALDTRQPVHIFPSSTLFLPREAAEKPGGGAGCRRGANDGLGVSNGHKPRVQEGNQVQNDHSHAHRVKYVGPLTVSDYQ